MQVAMVTEEVEVGHRKNKITSALRDYVPVDTGLTWQAAQEARRQDRSLIIVREGTEHTHNVQAKQPKQKVVRKSKKRLRRGKTVSL